MWNALHFTLECYVYKKTTDLRVKTWGGIKDMLLPPCQNMWGIHPPHPPPPPGFTPLIEFKPRKFKLHCSAMVLNCVPITYAHNVKNLGCMLPLI